MLQGKVNAALRLLSKQSKGGIVSLNKEVLSLLQEKHPPAEAADPAFRISGCSPLIHPVIFSGITAELIRNSALHTHGAAGPSGGDADQWRHMCCSFQASSNNLCDALASVAKRLATEMINPSYLEAFLSNRLIPLDKTPGVRPIGIGEIPRRIIGKTIIRFLKNDIQQAAGPLQLCAGQEAGCEAAIHAINQMFEADNTDAILLVDADNAFNRLNRSVGLWNIQFTCPKLAIYSNNCYQRHSRLFITGGGEISSCEGTTQGDPLAMPFYALSLIPLISELHEIAQHIWYADDAQAAGKLHSLRSWWDLLRKRGPGYGYFVNASKTILVAKPQLQEEASKWFEGTGICCSDGARDLGAAIGSRTFISMYVAKKMSVWCDQMKQLSKFAVSSPHAAFSAFVHGMRHQWAFVQRTIHNISSEFEPLEEIIRTEFIPALLGGRLISDVERDLLSLSGKFGGLSIDNPVKTCDRLYGASCVISRELSNLIIDQGQVYNPQAIKASKIKQELRTQRDSACREKASKINELLPQDGQRALQSAQEKGASFLVSALPLKRYGFSLSKSEFRDQILMRYRWPIPDLPVTCACGKAFNLDHSQICHLGGFINMRHDEVRNLLASEIKQVLKDVQIEPLLQPITGENLQPRSAITTSDARSDIRARGFWNNQQNAFFDIRVFYPHALSYLSRPMSSLYISFEKEKKRAYNDRILNIENGSFTPLVFSSNGGMGIEANIAVKKLATMLSEKRGENYSHTMGLLRCRIAFALMRASNICLRGSRCRHQLRENVTELPADLVISESRMFH
jgi:hypothetical protein